MYRNVLVPLDGSLPSEAALAPALTLARAGARVHLAIVRQINWPVAGMQTADPEQAYITGVAREFEDQAGAAPASAVLQDELAPLLASQQTSRTVARLLHEHIREQRIDLVVMTTHGRGGVKRAWLGSVADDLVRRGRVPVLLIRPSGRAPWTAREQPLHHFLVPLDGSAIAEAGIAAAAAFPSKGKPALTLLRVVEPIRPPANPYVSWVLPPIRDIVNSERRDAKDYIRPLMDRLAGQGYEIDADVVIGSVAGAILRAARRHKVDAIAIATHGAGGATRAVIGSVADKIVRAATIPVLVVRPDPEE